MASRLLGLAGLVEILFPGRIVALAERLAFRDRGDARLRPWIRPVARVEGLLWVLLSRRDSSKLRWLFGFLGVPMLLAPERMLDLGLKLAYEQSETIEVTSWVVPVTRVIGLVYVLVGVRSLLGRRTSAETVDESDGSVTDGAPSTTDAGVQA